ncbi:MAG: endolytic transglycosylase MltG [Clostridia bacterium]|nr:endolytic transglycosylase MltG [Clostridia bacterium]
MKKLIKTIVAALVCLAVIIFALNVYTDVFGGAGTNVEMTVPKGATGGEIVDMLKARGVIEYPFVFKIYAAFSGMDSQYKSGDFAVNTGNSYKELLDILTGESNSVVNKVKITIPEGFETDMIAAAMEQAGICSADEFLKAASTTDYDFDFLDDIDNKSDRKYVLEGYLFPTTYTFNKNTPASEVVYGMLTIFEQVISKYDIDNIDETVILASVIEREALGDVDRRTVSSVFHNRLNGKGGLTKLQSCATVQYILGERKSVLSEADTKIDSPYNTYLYEGLPVGPIANPGEESIAAAINPEDTDYLYFGVNKSGKHTFSVNYEEHLRATQ